MNGDNQTGQPASTPAPEQQPAGQWNYVPNDSGGSNPSSANGVPYQPSSGQGTDSNVVHDKTEFEWTGSEFIAHSKGAGWYAAYAAASLVGVVGAYFVTRDIVPTIMVAAIAIIFGVAANRPPRTLTYRIVPGGIYVGRQFYPFKEYKSFSLVEEGAFSNITFWPLKRFGLPLSLYYDPKDEETIATILSNHVPMQPHQIDLADRVMRAIRF
jgi:hypothetical protein